MRRCTPDKFISAALGGSTWNSYNFEYKNYLENLQIDAASSGAQWTKVTPHAVTGVPCVSNLGSSGTAITSMQPIDLTSPTTGNAKLWVAEYTRLFGTDAQGAPEDQFSTFFLWKIKNAEAQDNGD